MLEFEVETPPGLAGDLAVRIMSIWPSLEIAPEENRVLFHLPVDDRLDVNISLLEEALQAFERTRNLNDLNIVTRNLTGPDAGPVENGCEAFDFDTDGDVDMGDFAAFQAAY